MTCPRECKFSVLLHYDYSPTKIDCPRFSLPPVICFFGPRMMQSVTRSNFEERLGGSLADSASVPVVRTFKLVCHGRICRQFVAPISCLQSGLRTMPLCDEHGRALPSAFVLCRYGTAVLLSSALCAVPFGHRVRPRFTIHAILHRLHRSLRCVGYRTEIETVLSESSERAQSVRLSLTYACAA